jgi:hypothetical protein
MKTDLWFWVIVVIVTGILIIGLSSCSAMRAIVGMPATPGGEQIVIPSSPATQMWKVVASS